jgi:adenine deaminase
MNRDEFVHLLAVARGDMPADLVLKNGLILNVFTGELLRGDVAIAGSWIAGVGPDYVGNEVHDLGGAVLVPGLIDGHVHIESSMVGPAQFARAVIPRGTTTVIADPHEIANVAGAAGIRYMLEASHDLPLSVLINLPSCVPATSMGTSGATLEAEDLLALAGEERVLGLAEFMNVPGAVLGLPGALEKLLAFQGKVIDGHAPGVSGKWLQAYLAGGPMTDHESMTAEEALEKVRAGMMVLIRESTAAHNLKALLPAVTPRNARRFAFATDDRHPADLLDEGHMDYLVRLAIGEGLDPVMAIQMATLHAAEAFGLRDRGAIAAGRRADLVVTPALTDFRAARVYTGGRLVASDGLPCGSWSMPIVDDRAVRQSVHVDLAGLSLAIPAQGARLHVVGVVPDQVVTEHLVMEPAVQEGLAVVDLERDLLKLAVVERHGRTGKAGRGFVHGLGLQRGALAGSVGHDAHNITVAGADDRSMLTAIAAVARMGGGLAVALGDEVLAELPLPIGGLMSDQPVGVVRSQMDALLAKARELGSPLHDPFMQLGFLALEVIPRLKLTDQGLVDVEKFDFIPLWAD